MQVHCLDREQLLGFGAVGDTIYNHSHRPIDKGISLLFFRIQFSLFIVVVIVIVAVVAVVVR
jgi:hypothetical protein